MCIIKIEKAESYMDEKKLLLNGNEIFVEKVQNNPHLQDISKSLVKDGQHPYALVITCSDSRVVPEILFYKWLGELFVIRTAGNVINPGELATIEYAIEHLHINYIMVLGHTHCGAVHAAIKNEQGQYLDPILSRIKLAINKEEDETKASILNAKAQVQYIKEKFPHYEGTIESALYNIEDNTVSIL